MPHLLCYKKSRLLWSNAALACELHAKNVTGSIVERLKLKYAIFKFKYLPFLSLICRDNRSLAIFLLHLFKNVAPLPTSGMFPKS